MRLGVAPILSLGPRAYTSTDFDDVYDRAFFHVICTSQRSVAIYPMTRRTSRTRDAHWSPAMHSPAAVLEFGGDGSLGSVRFAGAPAPVAMANYLRKTSMFGRSLSRKFACSDGREYKWVQEGGQAGPEWTCTTPDNFLVAQYDLKPAKNHAYPGPSAASSGNSLTIHDGFGHLTLELLVSFIIMRHIQQYNL
uniref:DUF6593 domain-containing protein n=1 Tax=Mycena chlorophos TaxID=658473 RepID=A0ABQ0LL45_MYCCL|nr:predicted protein [Mycena chlorophos]